MFNILYHKTIILRNKKLKDQICTHSILRKDIKNIVPMGCAESRYIDAVVETSPKVQVKKLHEEHPAHSNNESDRYGLFAIENINRGEIIGEYVGKLCTKDERSKTSEYLLKHSDELFIDAAIKGNETKYINDYRDIQNKPNVSFKKQIQSGYEFSYKNKQYNDRVMVIAIRSIKQDEEVLVDYGVGYCKKWNIIKE